MHKFLKQTTFDAPKLLGARFKPLDNKCDNCKEPMENIALCIFKTEPPKKFRNIYILCSNCRSAHSKMISWYLYLNH